VRVTYIPLPVITEEQLQRVRIDWENKKVTKIEGNEEQVRQEPVKKGKAQTVLHTVAELGRKIVPSIRKKA
jgi:hypothetical protein